MKPKISERRVAESRKSFALYIIIRVFLYSFNTLKIIKTEKYNLLEQTRLCILFKRESWWL